MQNELTRSFFEQELDVYSVCDAVLVAGDKFQCPGLANATNHTHHAIRRREGDGFIWSCSSRISSRKHGITIVVENRPGAGGLIGVNAVRQAAPDGYTLGYFGSTNAIALRFIDKGVLVGRDVQAIGQIAKTAVVTVVNPNVNSARSLTELVSYLRRNPGTTYATVGVGSLPAGRHSFAMISLRL